MHIPKKQPVKIYSKCKPFIDIQKTIYKSCFLLEKFSRIES